MSLDTDFNQSPYYDDFDENKNFHRVLFKPGVAVQARELTQLQTILQNQIERFGDNILVEGTIIDGCNFVEVKDLNYVKIKDLNTNGQPVVLSNYVDAFVYGQTNGIKAKIQAVEEGLESDGTNLKTIFVKYLSSNGDIKTFGTSEPLIITSPSTNSTIDTVTAAGAALTTPADAIGSAYAVKVSDGIIYQKGFFVAVDSQLTVVSKYTNQPDNLVVGFVTEESIVDSNADTSLLDNANGFNNYNAPGADRLKLTPTLKVMTTAAAEADDTFFSIQEYKKGKVVRRNNSTQYNKIMDIIEKRTKDESGNYTVKDFTIIASNNGVTDTTVDLIIPGSSYTITSNGTTSFTSIGADSNDIGTVFTATSVGTGTGLVKPNKLDLSIGAGLAYVEGKRVELLNSYYIDLPKATTYNTSNNQTITTNYGNYILTKEYMGKFDFHKAANVYFYDANTTGFTSNTVTPSGTKIGQGSISTIIIDDGTPGSASTVYRMYIFNVKMDSGKNWNSVKSIAAEGNTGVADLVSTTIYEPTFKSKIFPTGANALRSLPTVGSNVSYVSRTSTTVSGSANTIIINTPSGSVLPYTVGQSLNATQKNDILVIAGSTSAPYTTNKPIDLTSANVYVSNTTSITISGLANTTINNTVYYNVKYTNITSPTQKSLETVYVKIDCATNAANSVGPWCLGIPDVYSIENVWINTGSYAETNSKKSYATLNPNRQIDSYGLSTFGLKPGSGVTSSSKILVKVKAFKKDVTDNGFYSISSYPIDDVSTSNTAAITTDKIPNISSGNTIYIGRDSVDFRPYAANTAAYSSTSGGATENPVANTTFKSSNDLKIPVPNEAFTTNYDYYLGRKDLVFINEYGDFALKQGVPSTTPKLPSEPALGMVLAELSVPPFPSISVDVVKRNHRRYTMSDVANLDTRLQSVEYYTALNLLETKTKDLIVSDASGNDRFKNGIFVDDFQDLDRTDTFDPAWAAGWHSTRKEIIPNFTPHVLKLKLDPLSAGSNTEVYRDVITLKKTTPDQLLISQNVASQAANTTINTTKVDGKIEIYPAISYGKTSTSYKAWYNWARRTFYNYWAMPNMVNIRVTGLKANTKYYVTLNGLYVIARPAYYVSGTDIMSLASPGYGTRIVPNKTFNSHWSEEDDEVFPGQVSHSDYKYTDYPIYSDSTGMLLAQLQIFQNKLPLGTHTIGITEGSLTAPTCSIQYQAIDSAAQTLVIGSKTWISSTVTQNVTTYTNDAQPFDHISQTFKLDTNVGQDSVIFLDKLDLYFATKPASTTGLGATVEIMETINGLPNPSKILTSVYLPNSSINANSKGASVTTVTLTNPIAMKTNAMYALTIIADQHSKDFTMCTAVTGNADQITPTLKATNDSFTGSLYTGTNGTTWTPISNERLKFKLYNASYVPTGYSYLTNRDHEFFTCNNYNTLRTGTYVDAEEIQFKSGELVAKLNANLAVTLSVNTANLTAVASSNSAGAKFVPGDYIAYYTVDDTGNTVIDAIKISSDASAVSTNATATIITLESFPRYTNATANVFQTIVGTVSYHDEENGVLHLMDSSAHAGNTGGVTTWFTSSDNIIGVDSRTTATIQSVDDIGIGAVDANISETNYTYTSSSYTTQILKAPNTANYVDVATNEEFTLLDIITPANACVIPSTSREYANNIGQGFRVKVDLKNTGVTPYESTPAVDIKNSTVEIWEYSINNDATGEGGKNSQLGGNALSRYISQNVTLAENLDAEDLVVYLTAYKPPGADLKVYGRFKNKNDNRDIYDIEWSPLNLKANTTSSATNVDDYRELEFRMPSVSSSSALVSGNGAALDSANSGVLTYKDLDGALYTGYKDFAVKVVLLTSDKKNIPRIKDIRAIALT